jgi:hypothetical protein
MHEGSSSGHFNGNRKLSIPKPPGYQMGDLCNYNRMGLDIVEHMVGIHEVKTGLNGWDHFNLLKSACLE